MALHIYCPTEKVILLVGFRADKGLLVFPSQNDRFPGILFDNVAGHFINDMIRDRVEALTEGGQRGLRLNIEQEFAERMSLPDGQEATLYLGVVGEFAGSLSPDWKTLPELIRKMPKDKKRIAYIKAWQILSGGL
ncbi:MAG: hypothetical protein HYW48_04255 [Deltaproteobacteria bacterium]|nr:hypothetical protein [Deltaproteobacteria bacterium]